MFAHVVNSGMSLTIEEVVAQLHQEVITLKAQVDDQTGLAEAPSLIDVEGLGRPKEFIGKEEDVGQWSKKTEAFIAGVTKESEMMLEWSAEQATDITHKLIDLAFLPTLEFVLQQMHTALLAPTSCEGCDIVANSRQNSLEAWRRLQKRYGPMIGGRKRNLLRTIICPGRCSLLELQAGIERWESYVSRCEKKLKDQMDDEIKLAGLEALVPEELEKHLLDSQLQSLANF